MSAHLPNAKVEHDPRNATSWKSAFTRRLASMKISEEYEYLAKIYQHLQLNGLQSHDALLFALKNASSSSLAENFRDPEKEVNKLDPGSKVCIIGAGMAGLYIAMILDALEIPNLSYEILEGSERVGGRVYTHHFSNKKHDYYDVGAMRFPDIKIMEKTFKLFKHLGPEKVPLIPYYLTSPRDDEERCNQPSRYNDRTLIGCKEGEDVFQVSDSYGGRIMRELVDTPEKFVTEAFEPFKSRLLKNWTKGFQALMKYDQFSVRGFMMSHGITPLDDYYSIQWLETLTDGSGLYDQGFSEGVIDSMDFDYYSKYIKPKAKVIWRCVDGGTQLVPEAMNASLKYSVDKDGLGKRVSKIAYDQTEKESAPIKVKVNGEAEARSYMTVFATPTLACLQRMDLTELDLLYEQKDALRSLHYDTASKVGMKFDHAWWIQLGIEGGLGKTDMPLRTCVYPSYNLDDSEDDDLPGKSAVLLCSYSWAQDAARIGSLMKGDWKKETELKEMLLNNLTWLHLQHAQIKNPGTTFDTLYKKLSESYIEHHAFDWYSHEFSSGAYGKFAPGQFSNLYPALTCPIADSRFHFVGEAVSAHHGWIAGALDSAHQAVINFLRRFNLKEYEDKLKKIDWLQPEPDEINKETAIMKVILGLMKSETRLEVRNGAEKEKVETLSEEERKKSVNAVEKAKMEAAEAAQAECKA